jgi:hypothetical protein
LRHFRFAHLCGLEVAQLAIDVSPSGRHGRRLQATPELLGAPADLNGPGHRRSI